jgi:hypothetical protein
MAAPKKARPGHHRCPRHGDEYKALEQCPKCKADPGPAPSEAKLKLPEPPPGCRSAADREAWFVKLADETLADVARMSALDSEDWHVEVAIKSHRDTAIKAMRAAQELGAKREEAELVEARRVANIDGSQ